VALLPEDEEGNPREALAAAGGEETLRVATRRVLLPLRPRDLEKERDPEGRGAAAEEDAEGEDADGDGVPDDEQAEAGDCMTVAQCASLNRAAVNAAPPALQQQIRALGGSCYRDVAGALAGLAVVGCE
jgi:hypothetical protein